MSPAHLLQLPHRQVAQPPEHEVPGAEFSCFLREGPLHVPPRRSKVLEAFESFKTMNPMATQTSLTRAALLSSNVEQNFSPFRGSHLGLDGFRGHYPPEEDQEVSEVKLCSVLLMDQSW